MGSEEGAAPGKCCWGDAEQREGLGPHAAPPGLGESRRRPPAPPILGDPPILEDTHFSGDPCSHGPRSRPLADTWDCHAALG